MPTSKKPATSGNDNLVGRDWRNNGFADTINGLAGDDTIRGGRGDDELTGGPGADQFVFSAGDGDDTITDFTVGIDKIRLDGAPSNENIIVLKNGDSSTVSWSGGNIFLEGVSYDTVRASDIEDGDGVPLTGKFFVMAQTGTSGVDHITANYGDFDWSTARPDRDTYQIHGGDGNDVLSGGEGRDKIYGDDGNDVISGGDNSLTGFGDELYGGAGNDELTGSNKVDRLYGGQDSDDLYGRAGNDRLQGGSGDDTLEGGAGADWLYGQDDGYAADGGNDTASYFYSNAGVTVDLGIRKDFSYFRFGQVSAGDASGDRLFGIENLRGSRYEDNLTGDRNDNEIHGGHGADSISGDQGNDALHGGWGNDTIDGGAGNDRLHGGNNADNFVFASDHGHDTITDFSESEGDRISLDGVTDFDTQVTVEDAGEDATVEWAGGTITLLNVDHTLITAKDFGFPARDDTPPAMDDDDDTIDFNVETDIVIIGASGDDTLEGTSGRDILFGEEGDDILSGGVGVDYLHGGAGNDVFKFGPDYDSDYDLILDFTSREDWISIEGIERFEDIQIESSTRTHPAYGAITVLEWENGKLFLRGDFTNRLTAGDFALNDSEPTDNGNEIFGVSSGETIEGGSGNNTIDAGGGDDTLIGGAGNDILRGGGGNDVFVFNANHGNDTIEGFRIGKDKIELEGITVMESMISDAGDDTRVSWMGGEIILEDILSVDVVADLDVVFD